VRRTSGIPNEKESGGERPRERVVVPAPTACPCCGGMLTKLGETITEEAGIRCPSVEGGADGPGEVRLPLLREYYPAADAVLSDRPAASQSQYPWKALSVPARHSRTR
jgi:hypothetical protein